MKKLFLVFVFMFGCVEGDPGESEPVCDWGAYHDVLDEYRSEVSTCEGEFTSSDPCHAAALQTLCCPLWHELSLCMDWHRKTYFIHETLTCAVANTIDDC